jgi:hypothetical protein
VLRRGDATGLRPTVVDKPTDYMFTAGHRIALLGQTSSLEWTAPKAYDGPPCPACASYSLELGPGTSLDPAGRGQGRPRRLFAAE